MTALRSVAGFTAFVLCASILLTAPSLTEASPSKSAPTPPPTNAPTDKKSSTSEGVGYLCAAVAVVFFGSNFIPVKKFESGDGMFFQFMMACGVFTVGHVVNAINGYPKFEPLAMLGGFLWAFGNLMSVPIIKCIGISLGLLIWGATNMMIGWGTGTFGWFDLEAAKRPVDKPWLNDLGFALAVLSLACYIFVQPSDGTEEQKGDATREEDPEGLHETLTSSAGYEHMVKNLTRGESRHRASQCSEQSAKSAHSDKSRTSFYGQEVIEQTIVERPVEKSAIDDLSPSVKRLLGVGMAMFAGCLFGATFNPPKWVEVHHKDAPQKDIDYVFAHFCGIWLTSLAALVIYTIYYKNEPFVFPKVLGPAYVSGLMWGIAQTCWFVANDALGFSKSFPLICAGPGLVSAMWGILLFNEIQGKSNFIPLGVACVLTISSSICVATS